jgi:NADH-quinone oxidoreductase subunit I
MSTGSIWDALAITFRNIFRGHTTEPLPWKVERKRPERFRATFALIHNEHGEEACIGCKICEKICPSEIIDVTPGGKVVSEFTGKKRGLCEDFTLDLNACIVCELCVQVCPVDAIIMLRVPEAPAYCREDLVLTMDRLYDNEKLDAASWGTGSRFMEMQDPKRGMPPTPKKVVKKPVVKKPPPDKASVAAPVAQGETTSAATTPTAGAETKPAMPAAATAAVTPTPEAVLPTIVDTPTADVKAPAPATDTAVSSPAEISATGSAPPISEETTASESATEAASDNAIDSPNQENKES